MKAKLILIVLVIFVFTITFQAQTKSNEKSASQSPDLKKMRVRVASLGVIYCKSNIVKPAYSQAAKAIQARGTVKVQVLINEIGKVVEAKAISGHPVLHANSIAAALTSTYEPVKLSGKPIKVSGVIVYNYSTDFFNWLEIGNSFGEYDIPEMLPFWFEEEKLLYKQYLAIGYDKNSTDFQKALKAIENKLSADKKSLWLFQIGMLLNKVQFGFADEKQLNDLKEYLADAPDNISPALISKLKNLLNLSETPQLNTHSLQTGNNFHNQMDEIKEKMFLLGN